MKDIQSLPNSDKTQLLDANVPYLIEFQVCSFFHPDMLWRDQLTHFIGKEEVERLDKKLKSLNVGGLDDHRIEYGQMFRYSTESIQEVVRDVASWSKVTK